MILSFRRGQAGRKTIWISCFLTRENCWASNGRRAKLAMATQVAKRPPAAIAILLPVLLLSLSLPMFSVAVPMGATTFWTPLTTGQQPVQSFLGTTSQVSHFGMSDALHKASAAAQERVHKLEKGLSRGLAEMVSNYIGAGGGGTDVVAVTLFVFLLSACMVVGHLMEEVKWLNESVTAVIFVSRRAFLRQDSYSG